MKKILFMPVLFMLSACASSQAQNTIDLPEPSKTGGKTIMESFALRMSNTNFIDKELSAQDLSDLLWAANGINRPDNGKRTAPSGLNAQDIYLYIALKEGMYRYDESNHYLTLVTEGDFRELSPLKEGEPLAPCVVYLIADPGKYDKFNVPAEKRQMLGDIDAGIVSQNIALFCAGKGLGTRPKAQMIHDKVYQACKLTGSQRPVLNMPVGYTE